MIKIIVQPAPRCITLLKYLVTNINKINTIGFQVQVDEVTAKQKEMLSKSDIKLLPVMITPDKKMFVGTDKIIELFERNINKQRDGGAAGKRSRTASGNIDVSEYLNDEIYAGVERNKKGLKVPQEREQGSDEDIDFHKKMSTRKVPKHYRAKDSDSESEEERPKQSRPARAKKAAPKQDYSDDDNIPDNDKETAGDDPLTTYMNMPGADVNDQMMKCLLENL